MKILTHDSNDVKLVLQPLAMRTPNGDCIYQPSRLRQLKTIGVAEFRERFTCQRIKVAFGDDIERWDYMDAYGNGLDCWYLVTHGVVDPAPSNYESGFNQDAEGNWFIHAGEVAA